MANGPDIEVWVADASGSAWAAGGSGDADDPCHVSAVGRELEGAVRRRGGYCGPSNLSHSGPLVAFAIARSAGVIRLGVDVELRRPVPRSSAFARRILAPGEQDEADLVGAWTLKEAALKATQEGLAGDPRGWRFDGLEGLGPRLVTAPPAWRPTENWAFLRAELDGPAALALAARLDKVHSVDVCVRSVRGPADIPTAARRPPFCLRWSPVGSPAASCAGDFRNRSDKVRVEQRN